MTTSAMLSSGSVWPKNYFATTHWSVVLAAGRDDTTRARAALEILCQTYWRPLYCYVRRRGYSPEDAQDLTQECFHRVLEGQSLAHADPHRGKFRSFLLGAMNHCLADVSARRLAQKRGSGQSPLSLEWAAAEQRTMPEPADHKTPDQAFDQEWATTLLTEVLNRLEGEYWDAGKTELFDALKQTLVGTRESQPYAMLAQQLGLNEGALRTAVHRLRKRYRELVREEIANTVGTPEEVDEEMRYLVKLSAGG